MMASHKGSCHCGRIAYRVDADFTTAMECNCSHCSRKGYLLAFIPADGLALTTGEGKTTVYRFNRHVIDHHFCPDCGCAPFGLGADPQGNAVAAINLRCLEEFDRSAVERQFVDGRAF